MNTVVRLPDPGGRQEAGAENSAYIDLVRLLERAHRRLLDVISDELDRCGQKEVNAVQALLLYNIGDSTLAAGDLRRYGYYLGTNVSYNLKKLVERGFISHTRSKTDRRMVQVKLTDAGLVFHNIIDQMFKRHAGATEGSGDISASDLAKMNETIQKLERFWVDCLRYRM